MKENAFVVCEVSQFVNIHFFHTYASSPLSYRYHFTEFLQLRGKRKPCSATLLKVQVCHHLVSGSSSCRSSLANCIRQTVYMNLADRVRLKTEFSKIRAQPVSRLREGELDV